MNRPRASPWVYLERELLKSRAWMDLRGVAPQVYGLFRLRIQIHKVTKDHQGKRSPFEIVNNGRIIFPYVEAKRDFGFTAPRFRRALTELAERGFLDVAHQGGGLEGNPSRYSISERWRAYGTSDFKAAALSKGRAWTTRRETQATNENVRATTNESVRG